MLQHDDGEETCLACPVVVALVVLGLVLRKGEIYLGTGNGTPGGGGQHGIIWNWFFWRTLLLRYIQPTFCISNDCTHGEEKAHGKYGMYMD